MKYEKYLSKNMYKIGSFFQLNWFNPLYLDRTGLVMAKTKDKFTNWNGGVDGFEFEEINKNYTGNVNIQKIWFGDSSSEWLRDFEIDKFQENIINDLDLLTDIYQPEYFSRIGFRLQLLLNKSDKDKIEKYNELYNERFKAISDKFSIKSSNIGFFLIENNYEIKVNLVFATRNENNSLDSPTQGFLFDIDFRKKYDNNDINDLKNEITSLFTFLNDNLQKIILDIIDGLWKYEK